jgi:hypothetical protein
MIMDLPNNNRLLIWIDDKRVRFLKHYQAHRKFGSPYARLIPHYYFKKHEPRVRRLLEANTDKAGFKLVESYVESFKEPGRILSRHHEFARLPLQMSRHPDFNALNLVTRLWALMYLDELEECFRADKHKIFCVGWHSLKLAGVPQPQKQTHSVKTRRCLTMGKIIWRAIGIYIFNAARTLKKLDLQRQRRVDAMLETLDTEY